MFGTARFLVAIYTDPTMTDTLPDSAPSSGQDQLQPIYQGLGQVVRALHDALTSVGADGALADASAEFPSARERLLHVATLTENAANTVLNKVDETTPVQRAIEVSADQLTQQWDANALNGMSNEAMQALAAQTRKFISASRDASITTQQALSDIMMAQDFQDLTGQLIKKVATLLQRTETDLLQLLVNSAPPEKLLSATKEEELAGPGAVGSIAMAQSDIDAMLADLGF
jgi:chemotaxis protein CheZ